MLCKSVLWECAEVGLRLISPFMPFLAEELWQRVTLCAGARIAAAENRSVTMAPFPSTVAGRRRPQVEQEVADLMNVVSSIRSCPLVLNHKGSRESLPKILIRPTGSEANDVLERGGLAFVLGQARMGGTCVKAGAPIPKDYISTPSISTAYEVYLQATGFMDAKTAEQELEKLKSKRGKTEKQLAKLVQSMSSPQYTIQAAPEAQQRDNDKKAVLEGLIVEIDLAASMYEKIRGLHHFQH